MTKRRRRERFDEADELGGLVALLIMIFSVIVYVVLKETPGGTPLAVGGAAIGLVGFMGFSITWQQMRTEQLRRKVATEKNWMILNPGQFEEYVADLFRIRGYRSRVVGKTNDGGIDIQLERDGEKSIAQCKRYSKPVGSPAVRDFFGALSGSGAMLGYFVTTSKFTTEASRFARGKPIELVDGDRLNGWAQEARLGPYAEILPRPRFYFTVRQWIVLTSLAMGAVILSSLFMVLIGAQAG